MKKPMIVITPQKMTMEAPYEGVYHYSNSYYGEAVLAAGGLPLIPPFLSDDTALTLMEAADGLVLSGGADIAPSLYGEASIPQCGKTPPERDQSDLALLKAALRLRRPVLCICRGSQLANAFLGGTLYQDLETQFGGSVAHGRGEDYRKAVHTVAVVPDTPLAKLTGAPEIGVNSLHHQAVKKLAPGLAPMAFAPDGLIESWYGTDPEQWLRGYQWHPEMLEDLPRRQAIFSEFLEACRKK